MPTLITLPSSACFSSVVMTLTRVVGVTTSPFTLETQTFKWQGEAWSMELTMPPFTNRGIAADWITFGVKLEGTYNYFLMGDPSAKNARGVGTGSPVVDGAAQEGNILQVKNWTPNINGMLLKGDYIQVGTGIMSRLHMVTEDVSTDALGNANISIAPALRYSPADGAPVVIQDAKGLFRLNSNDFSWSVTPGKVYRVGFNASEVL